MDYLKTLLEEDDIENIYETFNESVILKLNKDNIQKIIIYLQDSNIDFIYDILAYYTDLLVFDITEFIQKFEKIKYKYGNNYNEIIGHDLSILEQMYE